MLNDDNLGRIRALNDIAQGRGQSLAQMAIAWALRDPRVTSVLIGASSVAQLEQNVAALDRLDFTAEELATLTATPSTATSTCGAPRPRPDVARHRGRSRTLEVSDGDPPGATLWVGRSRGSAGWL